MDESAAMVQDSSESAPALYLSLPKVGQDNLTALTQMASFTIVDERTGEFVGLARTTHDVMSLYEALSTNQTFLRGGGFPILLATSDTKVAANTLVAPGLPFGEKATLTDALLPNDRCEEVFGFDAACEMDSRLAKIEEGMMAGQTGTGIYKQTLDDGTVETVHIAYAPVTALSVTPVDSSDFTRGVNMERPTVFSIALAQSEEGLIATYEPMRDRLEIIMHGMIGFLGQFVLVILCIIVAVLCRLAVTIVEPVQQLLLLVERINRRERMENFPTKVKTNRLIEVERIQATFEHLFLLVRFANTAFFAGDLSRAHLALREALKLFRKLNNKKAIGIVNNNLGNMMLTFFRITERTGVKHLEGMTKAQIIKKGCKYFNDAIESGEDALARINEQTGFSTEYLVFMQQLSNRYFNRAMFMLAVKNSHHDPESADVQGFMDLSTCRDMDREVVDNGDHVGFKGEKGMHFEVLMSRITGVLILMKKGYPDEWGIEDLLFEAKKELVLALKQQPQHSMFHDTRPAGQMQRLDVAYIDYYLMKGDKTKAAEFSIRMLVEDEYLLQDCAMLALKALAEGIDECDNQMFGTNASNIKATLYQYRQIVAEQVSTNIPEGSNDFLRRQALQQSHKGDFIMESF